MQKIIFGVIAVAVVAGGGYYYFNSKSADQKTVPPTEVGATTESAAQPAGKKMAFAEFIKQGGTYKCTVHQNIGGTETVGTTYLSGGMIRGEYSSNVQGMKMEMSMIVRDGYSYSWTSMTPGMGFKSKVVEKTGDTGAAASGSYSFNAEQIGDYNCEAWTTDASKFVVPSNVTFKEIGA